MKTQAAVLRSLNADLEIWDLEIPPLAYGQVLVEIAYSGVCRTQLNEIKGYRGPDRYLPHTLGHEGSGIVQEIGKGVVKVKPGDAVVLSWIKGSGIDAGGCKYGSSNGLVNSGPISTFMQYGVISENRIATISKKLPLREAALLGCALPTGAGVVFNQLQITKGCSLAVFGAGGVGLSAIVAAKYLEANPIVVVDISDEKLHHAQSMGATHFINSLTNNPVLVIQEITKGKGIDRVLECVGRREAMEAAFQSTSSQGICIIAGNLPKGQKIEIDPFDLIAGKKIDGSWGGKSDIERDMSRYTEMIMKNDLSISRLITHEAPLEKINELLSLLEGGQVGRAIVSFNK
ncbi:MAG: xylB 1 [Parachlamydiales bacterium]|nr:xylB 1 [Parachlamydiales bacterium]